MKKWLIFGIILFQSDAYSMCVVKDDVGRTVRLNSPAVRIVSLSPDLTEDLFAIGAGDNIVGVGFGSDYPKVARNITRVASYNNVDIESLLLLQPDLIVTWANGVQLSQLTKWNIPIYISNPHKILDIPMTLKKLGCLVGKEKVAAKVAESYTDSYTTLAKQINDQSKVKVFYQVWDKPLMTVTKGSWINEAIDLCGGKNIFADLKGAAPEVTLEAVVIQNPDLVLSGMQDDQWKKAWESWPKLTAVKQKNLININPDLLERPGPRLIDGVKELCISISNTRKRLEIKNVTNKS